MNAVLQMEPETARDAVQRLFAGDLSNGFRLAGLHRYNDADDRELYRVVRLKHATEQKIIRPMHLVDGRYRLRRPERPAQGWPLYVPPFPLVETDPTIIVEGEGCADVLARLGLTAVTSGSSSSADTADWTPLKGRSALLWPDHDEPGAKYGQDVARHLRALGCNVDVVDVAALNLPEGGDVVDWLAQHPGATGADILSLPAESAESAETVQRRGFQPAESVRSLADSGAESGDDPAWGWCSDRGGNLKVA